ncbi:MAG: addiction module protein [Planctomycetota bacterium]
MSQDVGSIAEELLALPAAKRAKLAETLLRSLDRGEKAERGEVDKAWAEEAERRLQEVRSGKVRCLSGEKVLREVRNRVKSR